MEATTVYTRDIAAIFISRIKCDNWSMCPLYSTSFRGKYKRREGRWWQVLIKNKYL